MALSSLLRDFSHSLSGPGEWNFTHIHRSARVRGARGEDVTVVVKLGSRRRDGAVDTTVAVIIEIHARASSVSTYRLNVKCWDLETLLDKLIEGALLASSRDEVSASSSSTLAPSQHTSSTSRLEDEALFVAMESIDQVHGNLCGYHALYNAICIAEDRESRSLLDEARFWSFVLGSIEALRQYQQQSTMWGSQTMEDGILDEAQMRWLIRNDPQYSGRIMILGSLDEALELMSFCSSSASSSSTENEKPLVRNDEEDSAKRDFDALASRIRSGERAAFVLGCYAHWIAVCVDGERREVILADSYNKCGTYFTPDAFSRGELDARAVAVKVVEEYRPHFRRKLRMSHPDRLYAEAPESVLDAAFDNGIPEYYRGEVKESVWWTHRPAEVRVDILTKEIEEFHRYVVEFAKFFFPSTTSDSRKLAPGSPSSSSLLLKSSPTPSGVRVDVTANLPSYRLRREGGGMMSVLPPPEIPGDAFDRQRVIPGFDQFLVEDQRCLVVGTGGIGMNVGLTLARLGVAEIVFFDFDRYEPSNLTRQCLGGVRDVGENKVDIAVRNIKAHNLRSRVRAVQADVVREWDVLVREAAGCTVLFNCCYAGRHFDLAINSLSKELQIPLVAGQSFGWKFMCELYSGSPSSVCAACTESLSRTAFALGWGKPWETIWTRCMESAGESGMVEGLRVLVEDPLLGVEQVLPGWDSQGTLITSAEGMREYLERYYEACTEVLLPGKVSRLPSLNFLPRGVAGHLDTRNVGSWVCPCLACGVLCVSQWASWLTGPSPTSSARGEKVPNTILFNMDTGMTADEETAYELPPGVALSRADRTFVGSPSATGCRACAEASASAMRREIEDFGSSKRVWLRPFEADGGVVVRVPQKGLEPVVNVTTDREKTADGVVVVIPSVPALGYVDVSLSLSKVSDENGGKQNDDDGWTNGDLPRLVLVKSREERCPSAIRAFASGMRSAVVRGRRTGTLYRLKGCGNEEEGFPLVPLVGNDDEGKPPRFTLRGCMFESTCAREMHMTRLAGLALEETSHMEGANVPLGFYRYPFHGEVEQGLGGMRFDVPEMGKFCGVFKTVGDRRLGDHFIAGLEVLFALGVNPSREPEARRVLLDDEEAPVLSTAEMVECGIPLVVPDDYDVARNLLEVDFSHPQLDSLCCEGRMDGSAEEDARAKVNRRLWEEAREDSRRFPSVLLYLAIKIGYDCGRALRALHSHGISWGTYRDELGFHCNAHANNFVVRPISLEEGESPQLLFPLDFDMAFTRETHLPPPPSSSSSSSSSLFPVVFDEILEFEREMGMKPSLAGSNFSSTGVSNDGVRISKVLGDAPAQIGALRTLWRNIMMTAFDEAVRGGDGGSSGVTPWMLKMEEEAKHVSSINAVVLMALMITRDVIT